MVECHPSKLDVACSSHVIRSLIFFFNLYIHTTSALKIDKDGFEQDESIDIRRVL